MRRKDQQLFNLVHIRECGYGKKKMQKNVDSVLYIHIKRLNDRYNRSSIIREVAFRSPVICARFLCVPLKIESNRSSL
jgi:hypothetical protein